MKEEIIKEELLKLCCQIATRPPLVDLGELIQQKSVKVATLKPKSPLFDNVVIFLEEKIIKEVCYSGHKVKLSFKVLSECFSKYQIGYSFRDDLSRIFYLEHSFPMMITTDLNGKLVDNNKTFEIINPYGEKESIEKDFFPIHSLCFKYL